MIIVLFGQPSSGKTTIATELLKYRYLHHIDGDNLRMLFSNTDYSRKSRIVNLNRASDIAHYLNSKGGDVVLSLIYPYKEARDYLNSLTNDIAWVMLTTSQDRGKLEYKVLDFEIPSNLESITMLNTDNPIKECCDKVLGILQFIP